MSILKRFFDLHERISRFTWIGRVFFYRVALMLLSSRLLDSIRKQQFMTLQKLIVIIGPTAVGKTDLSLALAQEFESEILNTDALQVYRGLPIATNKPSEDQLRKHKHHMISIIEPSNNFSVRQYRDASLEVLREMKTKCKMPILVGGTNYYLESILWENLVDDESVPQTDANLSCQCESWKTLFALDPETAQRIHQSDKRRISRSLQVINQYGRKLSEILDEQHQKSQCSFRGQQRFEGKNVILIWLDSEHDVLVERIRNRIEEMLNRGLLNEVEDFWFKYGDAIKDGKGIMKCIGLKEFLPFLKCEDFQKKKLLLPKCIRSLTGATIRYSNQQRKWIKNRLLRDEGETFDVHRIDCTSVLMETNSFYSQIIQPCIQLIRNKFHGENIELDNVKLVPKWKLDSSTEKRYRFGHFVCNVCNGKTFNNEQQYEEHILSRSHKKRSQNLKAIEKIAWMQGQRRSRKSLSTDVKISSLCKLSE
ncbi:hypothetical protein ACOME3_003992 [Neoechinorhynchus agilis]